jgi:DNA-binding transcriptional LysR family regulator
LAQDSAGTSQSPSESGLALLRRADELLDMVEQGKAAQSKTDPRAVEQRKFRPR